MLGYWDDYPRILGEPSDYVDYHELHKLVRIGIMMVQIESEKSQRFFLQLVKFVSFVDKERIVRLYWHRLDPKGINFNPEGQTFHPGRVKLLQGG
jgi:hypothetical protein